MSAIRLVDAPINPDHHLWNNNGTWWCHATVHGTDHTKHRVRVSLETKDVLAARQLRDSLLRLFCVEIGGARA